MVLPLYAESIHCSMLSLTHFLTTHRGAFHIGFASPQHICALCGNFTYSGITVPSYLVMRLAPSWRPFYRFCFMCMHTFCTNLQHTPMNTSVMTGAKVPSTTLIYLSISAPSSWLLMSAHIMLNRSTSKGATIAFLIKIDSCSLSYLQKPVQCGSMMSFLKLRQASLLTCVLISLITCSAIVTGYMLCATVIESWACSCFTS